MSEVQQSQGPSVQELREAAAVEAQVKAAAQAKAQSLAAAIYAHSVKPYVLDPAADLAAKETELQKLADRSLDAALVFARQVLGIPIARAVQPKPVRQFSPEGSEGEVQA